MSPESKKHLEKMKQQLGEAERGPEPFKADIAKRLKAAIQVVEHDDGDDEEIE